MNTLNWMEILAIAVAALMAVTLMILIRKGLITEKSITATDDFLSSLPIYAEDGFVGQLYNYCRLAVRAVEQLVKNGAIPMDDAIRRMEAFDQVERFAKIDGLQLGETDKEAIEDLIEAAVKELPKTNKK